MSLLWLAGFLPQAQYRRLSLMYDELKAQKISEMEGLLAEQDKYILAMGEVRGQAAGGRAGRGRAAP